MGEGAGGVGQGGDVLPPPLLGRQVHEGEEGTLHLADLMQEVSLPLLSRLGPVLPARAKRACMLDLSYRG